MKLTLAAIAVVAAVVCVLARAEQGGSDMAFSVTSTAFTPGGKIPSAFTADGKDSSPALAWVNPPSGTQAFALICGDPDAPAGTWVHWLTPS